MQTFMARLLKLVMTLAVTLLTVSQPGEILSENHPSTPLSSINVTAISAGEDHTCALTGSGGVLCWGHNSSGQLGNGSTVDLYAPMYVVGLSSGVASVSAGGSHTCALTTAGAVKCWGENSSGQLGDGTVISRLTPVDVSGLSSGVSAISAGGDHTCALTSTGAVYCWGNNFYGQVGNSSNLNRLVPVVVSGPLVVAAVSAGGGHDLGGHTGGGHNCLVTTSSNVYCWGDNSSGQLGINSTDNQRKPTKIYSFLVASISSGGKHTCALTASGAAWCWGYNFYGQVGNNSTSDELTPVSVSGLSSGVTSISAGGRHTCALTSAGGVKCWGRNIDGELGDDSTQNRITPVNVFGLTNGVASISAGGYHTCARITGGTVKCWGYNLYGQLGNGTTTSSPIPINVVWLTGQIFLPMVRR